VAVSGFDQVRCFHPLDAWTHPSGGVFFGAERKDHRPIKLRCGQCIGCRVQRSVDWAVRCMHEAQLHEFNSFVTLTYKEDDCPVSLNYRDFQLFMKKARRRFGPFRFYMCGEYGDQFKRPHFHACFFGFRPTDLKLWRRSSSGFQLYRSPSLEETWDHGFVEVGDVTFQSAAYIARYVCKKVTGAGAEAHYEAVDGDTGEIFQREPEFTRMSLKPGIAMDWLRLFHRDVEQGYVVQNGQKRKVPRFYEKYLSERKEMEEVLCRRILAALKYADNNTPERLAISEFVAEQKLAWKVRNLE
jgi:hypothetical protein